MLRFWPAPPTVARSTTDTSFRAPLVPKLCRSCLLREPSRLSRSVANQRRGPGSVNVRREGEVRALEANVDHASRLDGSQLSAEPRPTTRRSAAPVGLRPPAPEVALELGGDRLAGRRPQRLVRGLPLLQRADVLGDLVVLGGDLADLGLPFLGLLGQGAQRRPRCPGSPRPGAAAPASPSVTAPARRSAGRPPRTTPPGCRPGRRRPGTRR